MVKSTMLFDVLANILKTKSLKLYEEHIKSENFKDAAAFMIRRYLTMHPNPAVQNIVLDNFMSLERMSDTQLYRWLIYAVPRQNTTFIKYIR
jgi:hypothetical protein